MNPWLRLFIPLALVLLATAAIWAPKLGWFDALGSTDSGAGSGIESGAASEQGLEAGPAAAAPPRPDSAVAVTVDYVHDGDTLFVYPEQPTAVLGSTEKTKVRLLGIDTPEVGENAECFGAEATEALRALLPEGSTAWALTDVNPTDKYGRSLLLMWTDDGRFVNNELLLGGAATVLQIDPNRAHTALFQQSEAAAAESGAGLWGAC
ncbi:nuclease-like protein [Microterricola gilva]|uniref:Nuclease-like protein n=2 Tax=Microterricola gilva TaxID=393267 RepID=A0A4Q8AJS3_9MICO|nr:nuclease-like protein [Microterricola gilva]